MTMRSRSLFRPWKGVDRSVLDENRPLVRSLERRLFLRQGLSLGALTLLTGCDISNKESVQAALKAFSHWNDRVQAWLFERKKLAPTFETSAEPAAALQRLLQHRYAREAIRHSNWR